MHEIYEPAEDSFLLQKHIKDYAKGLTLDMGTGAGIQAIEAAKYAKKVIAVDLNPAAIKNAKKAAKGIKNIKFIKSDLFAKIKGKFDCIIFNPPYLPSEKNAIPDIALDSGTHGFEIIIKFLEESVRHLKDDGKILLLFSSLSKPEVILKKAEELLLDYKLIDQQHIFFEDLFVYEFRKSALLLEFESKKVFDAREFTHGKHGKIYTGAYKGKKVAIKTALTPQFETHIQNEAIMLKRINKLGIGPKLLFSTDAYFAYTFIEGKFILGFLEKAKASQIKKLIKEILMQCRILDKRGLSKFEMTKPVKHIIVQKNGKAVMIDFERCKHTKKPKNVTQFCQFIISPQVNQILAKLGININQEKLIEACKEYKRNPIQKKFVFIEEIVC
ncbi:MAG: HemK2/MTQ2 family protein methyltransferase [Nanoarchaeota archaeon]